MLPRVMHTTYSYTERQRSADSDLRPSSCLCCCPRIHVKTGTRIMCLVELATLCTLRGLDLAHSAAGGQAIRVLIAATELGAWLVAVVLLLTATKRDSSVMLIPHAVVQITHIMLIVCSLVLIAFYCMFGAIDEVTLILTGDTQWANDRNISVKQCFHLLADNITQQNQNDTKATPLFDKSSKKDILIYTKTSHAAIILGGTILILACLLAMDTIFLLVVIRCYYYFEEKHCHRTGSASSRYLC